MTNTPLFTLTRAEDTIIVTPQRDLSDFDFIQIETAAAEVLGQITGDGGPNVVVDFSKIKFCGSTALGFFARLFKKTRCRGGEMAVCNVSPDEREVLRVTRLDTLWAVCDSLDEAIVAVRSATTTRDDVTWIVVADRAIARIFEQYGGSDCGLRAITTLRHPESRERMSDEVTDGAGSFRGGAIAGSESGEPNQDFRHHTAEVFARELSTYLDAARQRGEFSHLALIAAPLFLGVMRDCLPAQVKRVVEHEVARDYTHLDAAEIQTRMTDLGLTA